MQEDLGHAARRLHAERVAIARHVLDGHPAFFAADAHLERASFIGQLGQPGGGLVAAGARANFCGGEVADAAQQIVHLVAIARFALAEPLQLELEGVDR